jgi:hypothetical protein
MDKVARTTYATVAPKSNRYKLVTNISLAETTDCISRNT